MKNNFQLSPIPMTTWRSSLSLMIICLFCSTAHVFALPSSIEEGNAEMMNCVGSVNLSLDQDGCVTLIPEMLLLGTIPDYSIYTVDIMGALTDEVCCSELGQTLMVSVTGPDGNSCWSNVLIEDKLRPVITCMDIVLQCNEVLDESDMSQFITVSDNCTADHDLDIYFVDVLNDPMCDAAAVATIDRTYYVTDAYGSQSSCSMTITYTPVDIADVEFPADTIVYCPCDSIDLDSLGVPTIDDLPVDQFCELIVFSTDQVIDAPGVFCSGTKKIIRTWTVMDWCDSSVSEMMMQTIEVQDTLAPVITCPDPLDTLKVHTNADCLGEYVVPALPVTDACSDDALITFDVFNNGAVVVGGVGGTALFPFSDDNVLMYVATDHCGNKDTCEIIVEVIDVIPPALSCSDQSTTLEFDDELELFASAYLDEIFSDNCNDATLEISLMAPNCDPDDVNPGPSITLCCADSANPPMVVLTATDAAGNSTMCMFEIKVVDQVAPDITCQAITVYLDENNMATIDAMDAVVDFSDNCGIATVSSNPSVVTCADMAAGFEVEITATDAGGLTSTCMAGVTILDTFPPAPICQSITVDLDPTGNATITGADINNGSTDACGNLSYSLMGGAPTLNCDDIGTPTDVILIVTDDSGNFSTCTATVAVQDTTAPTCLTQNFVINLTGTGDVTITTADIDNGSFDECGEPVSLALDQTSFNCTDAGPNTVTLTVTDASGNTSECTATVTVNDGVAPTCTLNDITVTVNGNETVTLTLDSLSFTTSDACGAVSDTTYTPDTFDCMDEGPNVITIEVEDASGNTSTCTANAQVVIGTIPICPAMDITVFLDATGNISITPDDVFNNAAVNNCGTLTATAVTQMDFDCSMTGPNTVTLTVTDGDMNTSTCDAIVTVVDNLAPVCDLNFPTVMLVLGSDGEATLQESDYSGIVSDNCGIVSMVPDQILFTCADEVEVVVITVTDNNGIESLCFLDVDVEDDLVPEIICPDNITVECGDITDFDNLDDFGVTTADDECDVITLNVEDREDIVGNCGFVSVIRRRWVATDTNGNTSDCSQNITILDTQAPTFVSGPPVALTVDLSAGVCDVTLDPLVVDDCGTGVTITNDQNAGGADASGTYPEGVPTTITYTATDCSGNIFTYMVVLTVTDTGNNCPPPLLTTEVIGRVTTIDKDAISGVSIDYAANKVLTDENGEFKIDTESSDDLSASFSYSDDWYNGVNVQDVRLLHRQLTGETSTDIITSIASDIQGDGKIDYQDLTITQHSLLGMADAPQSWTFVNAADLDQDLIDIRRDELTLTAENQIFGIKLGDLNGDASLEKDGMPMMDYRIENREIEAGEVFEISLDALQGDIDAIQYSLQLSDDVELVDLIVEEGTGTNTMTHYDAYENTINVLAYVLDDDSFRPQIIVKLQSTKNGTIADALSLGESVNTMGYTSNGDAYDLELRFGEIEVLGEDFAIKGNFIPNPFVDFTEIQFEVVNEREEVQFEIFNAAGSKIHSEMTVVSKGLQTKRFERKVFENPGVFYVSIRTATSDSVSKVVMVK